MAFENWEKRPNGDIAMNPLMGWDIASLPMTGLVRIGYAEGQEALLRMSPSYLQVGMTAPQAREFGQTLLRLADHIEAQPRGTQQ